MVERIGPCGIFATFPNNDSQLALVIDIIAAEVAREHDRVARVLHRVGAFEKQDGILRDLRFGLLRVAAVIEADAQERGGFHRGEELRDVRRFACGRDPLENASGELFAGAVGVL